MAWNKNYAPKKSFYKKAEKTQFNMKRGTLSTLMAEEDKSFDELRVNVMAYTYILRISNGKYYVGSTYNLQNRLREHSAGHDFYTKAHLPVELVYFEERPEQREQRGSSLTLCRVVRGEDCSQYPTKEEAAKREYQLKGWSREKKEKLISGEWSKL